MNQFEKTAEALETAADEFERVPAWLREKTFYFSPDSLRKAAKELYDMGNAFKEPEVKDAGVSPS